jgi:hypothetical protein
VKIKVPFSVPNLASLDNGKGNEMKKLLPLIIGLFGVCVFATGASAQDVRVLPNAKSSDGQLIQADTRLDWPGRSQSYYHNLWGDSKQTTHNGNPIWVYWDWRAGAYGTADRNWYIDFGQPSRWYYWSDYYSEYRQEGT